MVQITAPDDKLNILDQIHLNLDDDKDYDKDICSYHDPMKDILFNHDFVASEVSKYDLLFNNCVNCNQVMNHFSDQCSFTDTITQHQISWIKFPESILTCPHPTLKTKITDPANMHLPLVSTRP